MNSSLLPPKWWYRLPTLDPARSTTSAMLASAKPCPVNTARAASSSARCVCAVLAHCQEPAPALPLDGRLDEPVDRPLDRPRGGRATGATGHHPFSERDSRSLTGLLTPPYPLLEANSRRRFQ